jgi:hypothetical protein
LPTLRPLICHFIISNLTTDKRKGKLANNSENRNEMQKDNYFQIQITLTIVELKKLNKVVQVTNPRKDPQQGSRRRREKKKHHKLRINCHSDEQ